MNIWKALAFIMISVLAVAVDPSLATQIAQDITNKLMPERHVNPRTQDFTVTAFAAIQQQIASVTPDNIPSLLV